MGLRGNILDDDVYPGKVWFRTPRMGYPVLNFQQQLYESWGHYRYILRNVHHVNEAFHLGLLSQIRHSISKAQGRHLCHDSVYNTIQPYRLICMGLCMSTTREILGPHYHGRILYQLLEGYRFQWSDEYSH
ncbi:hypothetical protein V3481_018993 [Fusarium oxysporum f. sp. vasinfectum]